MGVGSGREVQEGGDIYIHIADSLFCTAETNTTLESNYSPIKTNKTLQSITDNCILLVAARESFDRWLI